MEQTVGRPAQLREVDLCALAVVAGPFADDLENAIPSGPDAKLKLAVRHWYLAMLRAELPPDDFGSALLVLDALEAVPDRWLRHSASQRFIRNHLAKSRALASAPERTRQRYAAICLRQEAK